MATRLARAGGRVTLLEHTDTLGGRLGETRLGDGDGAMAGSAGGAVTSANGAADTGRGGPFRWWSASLPRAGNSSCSRRVTQAAQAQVYNDGSRPASASLCS